MKQAKQQSQDLRQTDEFLHSLISQDTSEKEKPSSKISGSENNPSRQVNGRPKMPRVDPISRFSDPPAPPPQQPLPEKPDAPRRQSQEAPNAPLKRSDTEKPTKVGTANSPVSRESSQILSLIEALSSAKKELDAQGARVKELEDLLRQERSARESAEERARKLEEHTAKDAKDAKDGQRSKVEAAFEPPPVDQADKIVAEEPKAEKVSEVNDVKEPVETAQSEVKDEKTSFLEAHSQQLQQRLDLMVIELAEMKQQVEIFKQRAEKAEEETVEVRKSLSEMIETLRREREAAQAAVTKSNDDLSQDSHEPSTSEKEVTSSDGSDSVVQSQHGVNPANIKELENTATALATKRRRHHLLEQSTPYASMLGVVLLGVGLMAYLNGWQKIDK